MEELILEAFCFLRLRSLMGAPSQTLPGTQVPLPPSGIHLLTVPSGTLFASQSTSSRQDCPCQCPLPPAREASSLNEEPVFPNLCGSFLSFQTLFGVQKGVIHHLFTYQLSKHYQNTIHSPFYLIYPISLGHYPYNTPHLPPFQVKTNYFMGIHTLVAVISIQTTEI